MHSRGRAEGGYRVGLGLESLCGSRSRELVRGANDRGQDSSEERTRGGVTLGKRQGCG